MMNGSRTYKIVSLVIVAAGVYQVIAALLALVFWLVAGDWRPFWPHITGVAFWIALPVSYWVWRSYWQSQHPKR